MAQITENEYTQLAQFIQHNFGIDLFEKKSLVFNRLKHILDQYGHNSFSEYFKAVISDKSGHAISELLNKLTTNYTFFMREAEHFEYFRSKVLPYLEAKLIGRKDLRIWSAACSSGEEPYTLAMIIADFLGENITSWDAKILATDISSKALETAKAGVYLNEELIKLPDLWRKKYFNFSNNETSVISDNIKKEILFRKFNLINDEYPFKKKFHVIFCRNVMIYFNYETKSKLINRFHDYLEDGGYLFVGHSESLPRENQKFEYIIPALYRKVNTG